MRVSVKNETHYRSADLAALIRAVIKDGWGEEGKAYVARVCYTRGGHSCSGYSYYNSRSFTIRLPRGEPNWEASFCLSPRRRGSRHRKDLADHVREWRRRWPADREAVREAIEAYKGSLSQHPNKVRPYAEVPLSIREDFARVVAHEMEHCRGVRHDGMCDTFKRAGEARGGGLPVPYAADLPIRAREGKAKPTLGERVEARSAKAAEALLAWQRRLKVAQTKVRKYRQKVAYYERRAAAQGQALTGEETPE